jgi:hypothetical protein
MLPKVVQPGIRRKSFGREEAARVDEIAATLVRLQQ